MVLLFPHKTQKEKVTMFITFSTQGTVHYGQRCQAPEGQKVDIHTIYKIYLKYSGFSYRHYAMINIHVFHHYT